MKSMRLARKRPQQRRSQAMVDAILDAATEVFGNEGFDRATTNAIAERAGVSVGSFYQYFPNKLALLDALRDRHVRGLWEKIGAACDEVVSLPLPDALRHIVAQCSAYNAARVPLIATMHRELPIHSHTAEQLTVAQATVRQKLKDFLEAHRSVIKVNIEHALFMIPALGRGIFTSAAIEQPDAVKNEQLVENTVSAILGYLT